MEESRRMPKPQRRSQLLQTAHAIIREEGTDALTLARVAERAGVTKPIAYEHFGTRSGLLIALYRDYDEQQNRAMRAAIQTSAKTLEDVASILSAAYVDCAVTAGPVYGDITAALSGSDEMEELLNSCRDSFIAECQTAITPFVMLSPEQSQAILLGYIGAAETLSQAAADERLSPTAAINALSDLLIGALQKHQKS
jgi:AcrR family transcriptional regulator